MCLFYYALLFFGDAAKRMCVGGILFSVTAYNKLFCVMWLGRRRSSRLIANPWLYNWTKKKTEYVTIDDDGSSGNSPEIVAGG